MSRTEPGIVLIGATGFTGGLVARELAAGTAPFVLAGRSKQRLEAVSADLGGAGLLHTMDVRDPDSLAALLLEGDTVINTAGPFDELGEPVVRACIDAGAHYVDTSGEQPFVREMHRRHDAAARERGVAIVPSMAYEFALGDCAIALAAGDAESPIRSVDVFYAWGASATSVGTRRTSLRIAGTRVWTLEGGTWRREPIGASVRSVRLSSGATLRAVTFGAGEVVTVPRHLDVDTVRGWLVMGDTMTRLVRLLSPALPILASVLRPVLDPVAARHPDPSPDERLRSAFTLRAELEEIDGRRRAIELTGVDPYGITATVAVLGARRAMDGAGRGGVLAPSQLVDPGAFLRSLEARGLTVNRNA